MGELVKVKPQIMLMTLEGASKLDLIRQFSNLTLAKIVENQYPNIAQLGKTYTLAKTESIIQVLLLDLSSSFGDELTIEQVEELSVELTSNLLVNLSLEDVYLVCRQIKATKNFGKLNVNKILNAFEEHFNSRISAFYNYNLNQEPKKELGGRINAPQNFKQLLSNIKNK